MNERQKKAMGYIREKGSISNKEYTILNNVSRKTATVDLTKLVKKGLVVRVGVGKRTIRYELLRNITQKLRKKLRKSNIKSDNV